MKGYTNTRFYYQYENLEPQEKKFQIEVKDDSFGCTINFANESHDFSKIKIELVRKNKSNKLLLDVPLLDFIKIVSAITKKDILDYSIIFVPFNLHRLNLLLNKDCYLLITLTTLGNDYLSHTLLKTRSYVQYPLEIENQNYVNTESAQIDTKNFNYLFCECKVAESVFNSKNLYNNFEKRKTYLDSFYLEKYLNYFIPTGFNEVFTLLAYPRKGGFNPLNVYLVK